MILMINLVDSGGIKNPSGSFFIFSLNLTKINKVVRKVKRI